MRYILLFLNDDNIIDTRAYDKFCQLVYAYKNLPEHIKGFPYIEIEGELYHIDYWFGS